MADTVELVTDETKAPEARLGDAQLLAIARNELAELKQRIGRLETMLAEGAPSADRPRRQLGRLAGKVHLTREQALAPMDEEELKAWGL